MQREAWFYFCFFLCPGSSPGNPRRIVAQNRKPAFNISLGVIHVVLYSCNGAQEGRTQLSNQLLSAVCMLLSVMIRLNPVKAFGCSVECMFMVDSMILSFSVFKRRNVRQCDLVNSRDVTLTEHLSGNMRIPSTSWSIGLRIASVYE